MRNRIVILLFFMVWLLLLVRLYYLSIKSNAYYDFLATQNSIKTDPIPPIRGNILDRKLRPLAVNQIGFKIMLAPHLGRKNGSLLEKEVDLLAKYLPFIDKEALIKEYKKQDSFYNHDFIRVIDFVPYEVMIPLYTKLSLRENVRIEPSTKRFYPHHASAAHVIGYVAKAGVEDVKKSDLIKQTGFVGKTGVENFYNDYLQGEAGYRKVKVTAFNEEIEEIERVEPVENRTLILALDLDLQKEVESLFEGKSGVAIVMDVKGQILAAGSFPQYDLNTFVAGISQQEWQDLINDLNHPFTNKISSGLYPPGSTIKMGVALSFLESGMIDEHNLVFCTGEMELGNRKFRCWKEGGHGQVDMVRAIRESCDDYFYKGSLKVGIDTMAKNLRKIGFGAKTGIDLPNEFIGVVPDKEWKRERYGKSWYMGETVVNAIGQGYFLTTPIQIAAYTALMATGTLPVPHLGYKMGDTEIKMAPLDVLTPLQKSKLPIIQKGMFEVCNHPNGTASHFITTKIKIAGKTGTAQVVAIPQEEKKRMKEHELDYYSRSHAWLTTYGPYENPQFVVTVLVEHGGHGGEAAGKIVSMIYNKLIELGYLNSK